MESQVIIFYAYGKEGNNIVSQYPECTIPSRSPAVLLTCPLWIKKIQAVELKKVIVHVLKLVEYIVSIDGIL